MSANAITRLRAVETTRIPVRSWLYCTSPRYIVRVVTSAGRALDRARARARNNPASGRSASTTRPAWRERDAPLSFTGYPV